MDSVTTELEAVNYMLRTIGEAPLMSLDDSNFVDAHMAKHTLEEATRELQAEGWLWNTVYEKTLLPDTNGNIYVPNNALKILPRDPGNMTIITRANKVIDYITGDDTWNHGVKVAVIYFIGWDNMPETAKRYAASKAARRFIEDVVGDPKLRDYEKQEEIRLRYGLIDEEAEAGACSMKQTEIVWEATEGRRTRNV